MPLDFVSKEGDNPARVLKNCNDDEGLQTKIYSNLFFHLFSGSYLILEEIIACRINKAHCWAYSNNTGYPKHLKQGGPQGQPKLYQNRQ